MKRPVALVTGASSGIGFETVLALAEEGYDVIAAMRDLSKRTLLQQQAKKRKIDRRIQVVPLDVSRSKEAYSLAERVRNEYARLDVLVNNAGIAVTGAAEEIEESSWIEQFETNFFGMVYVIRAFLPIFRQQAYGRIINISSGAAFLGSPFTAPYTASKCAVEGLSESLRLELLPFGIKVVLVEPGFYQTKILKQIVRVSEHSLYQAYDQSIQSFVNRFASKAKSPQEVAHKIVRIAKVKNPRMRYICGTDARFLFMIKRILPFSWIESIFRRLSSL